MRIIRFQSDDHQVYTGCDYRDGSATLIDGDIFGEHAISGERRRVKRLLPPVAPPAIFGIGLNYQPHIEETGMTPPENPVVFMKNPSAAAAHKDEIMIPVSCQNPPQVDYEAELGVVIKQRVKNATIENALDAVLGYTCANDVSARVWQKKGGGGQWVRGKGFDTFSPFGPWIVTPDEIPDPANLTVECRLNNDTMQTGNTGEMIFSVARLIAFLSESTTLLPGTLILTGTPSGVGFTREPPVFLMPGDEVEVEIEGIGLLKNQVIAET